MKTLFFYFLTILSTSIILALFYQWASSRRVKRVLKQLRECQAELHIGVKKLILIYDNFTLSYNDSGEDWSRFINEISLLASDLVDLKEKVANLTVPKILEPVQDNLIQASNNFSEHIFLITEATDIEDTINAFDSPQFGDGLDSLKTANKILHNLVNYYRVNKTSSGQTRREGEVGG